MRCNNCGWENPDGSQKCEKCNAPLQGGVVSNPQVDYGHSTIREDFPFSKPQIPKTVFEGTINENPEVPQQPQPAPQPAQQAASANYTGTMNPWGGIGGGYTPLSHCSLKPVIFPGEDMRDVPKEVNLKGNYTELNRQLLDPDNNTITSNVQAILTCKDGKWYIQDQSAQKTTFVYAGEPIPLKTGDVILMGNRTFVFEEK